MLLLLRICCCRGALLSACRALSAAHRLPRAARRHLHNSHAVSAVSAPAARLCLAGTGIPSSRQRRVDAARPAIGRGKRAVLFGLHEWPLGDGETASPMHAPSE